MMKLKMKIKLHSRKNPLCSQRHVKTCSRGNPYYMLVMDQTSVTTLHRIRIHNRKIATAYRCIFRKRNGAWHKNCAIAIVNTEKYQNNTYLSEVVCVLCCFSVTRFLLHVRAWALNICRGFNSYKA